MSLLDRARELEDISDAQLAQLVQQGSEAGDTWLAATETQRRKDMRDRYAAQQAKQQAANPPDIMTQRMGELGGGIPSADPNMGAPPDPSLQTGIAGPPPMMASGGAIRGYQNGDLIDPDDDPYTTIGLEELLDPTSHFSSDVRGLGPYTGGRGDVLEEAYPVTSGGRQRQTDIRRLGEATEMYEQQGIMQEDRERLEEQARVLRNQIRGGGSRHARTRNTAVGSNRWRSELADIEDQLAMMDKYPFPAQKGQDIPDDFGVSDPTSALASTPTTDIPFPQRLPSTSGDATPTYEDFLRAGDAAGGDGTSAMDMFRTAREDFRASQRDFSPEDEERRLLQGVAGDETLRQAQDLSDFDRGQVTEQGRILASRLGLSEEAVREMRSDLEGSLDLSREAVDELRFEMDTPEEVENRRKSAGYGALSSMFLNPDLAAGIGGMGKQITGMDDMLRAERKSALEKILAERKSGDLLKREGHRDIRDERKGAGLLEQQGQRGIYDLERGRRTGLGSAEIARMDLASTFATEDAARGRAGARELLGIDMEVANLTYAGEQALAAAKASSAAAFQEALNDRDNFLRDPKNWEPIMNRHADIVAEVEGNPNLDDAQKKVALNTLHNDALRRIQAIGSYGTQEANDIMAMARRTAPTP